MRRRALAIGACAALAAACRAAMGPVGKTDTPAELSTVNPPKASASASAKPPPPPPRGPEGYDKWKIPLETYVSHTAGAVPLGAERAELFVKYFRMMHDKVHPIFTASLVPLDERDGRDPMKNTGLSVELELGIDGATGKVKRFGVLRRSGIMDFDTLALDAIDAAQPFEPAPEALRSPDGNVWVRWTFR